MNTYITLIIYLLIFVFTGITFVLSVDKYFEIPSFNIKKDIKDFDYIIAIGLVLAFINSVKELVQIIPVVTDNIKTKKQKYLSRRRKDAQIEINIDDREVKKYIDVSFFKHIFIEGKKRYIGDDTIGRHYFTDVMQEIRLQGKIVKISKISYVTFEIYSEFPLPIKHLDKYISIEAYDSNTNNKLLHKVERLNNSLHRIDVYIFFNKLLKKGQMFDIFCRVNVPYCLYSTGDECLFSNANYYKINIHSIELRLIHKPPKTVNLKSLDVNEEFSHILLPTLDNDNTHVYNYELTGIQKGSKVQLEFCR